ncbi:calcineurin-like phosphoesterase C-terminal domain-containing protein [Sphingobacterium paludis]|uniref:3',5'-cyclic AMP phosphodiesterase CpdA n=1 Tax=Sphingobacterium paludis TaxID=1476465 RepID=A0A4R7DAR4_9SPHI|nr:calcineurin-like phosphoesterase family protein [Sphingobacterium paludis]TDS16166.1 3',5'-cyclic AMP phosphodiesterase CpdA [Sphingobacterium paludis]
MKNIFWALVACALSGTTHAQELARGVVYIDANANGLRDKKEVGLAGVSVSNGVDVVQTDAKGNYQLPVQDDNIIFVVKPSGYKLALDQENHPKFYHIHKPKGSPALKFAGVTATGKLPKSVDFALQPVEEPAKFSAFVFGDPQAYNEAEMDYFKRAVVDEAKTRKGPAFGISLGDLVGNDLSLHPGYKQTISQMELPWYNVIGNHDLNFDVKSDSLSDESFERLFGPANYAFNVGNAHFIILDDVLYPHPTTGEGYQGGFRKEQLDFVENNLRFVPKEKLVVLAFHIPLNPDNEGWFRNEDRQRLFDLLKDYPNTLSLSAHTHFQQQNYYNASHGWKGKQPHHEYNVGTTSGDWYSGQLNAQGVPVSAMRDGTPKGYAILHIDNDKYAFDYKVVGQDDDYAIDLYGPAVVSAKYVRRYPLYANFFIGAKDNVLRYRVDKGNWKTMERVADQDPAYTASVLAFDGADSFVDGRRPSDAVPSTHLWKIKLPKLAIGKHSITVEAKDMFGRVHTANKEIEVVE